MEVGKSLKVGAFQFAPCNNISKNLEAIKRGINEASKQNVRLLLTQECAICGYPPVEIPSIESIDQIEQKKAFDEIAVLAEKHNMFIAIGFITFESKATFNSIQLLSPNGDKNDCYHKRALWGWDINNFTPGNNIGVYLIDGFKVGIRICYEVRFPEYFRELFNNDVDLCIISFTDIGKPELNNKIQIIRSHLISRAAENAIHILSANSTSQYQLAPTCLINPDGKIIKSAPLNEEALIVEDIKITSPGFGREGRIYHSKMLNNTE